MFFNEIGGQHEEKLELKQLLFLRVYLSGWLWFNRVEYVYKDGGDTPRFGAVIPESKDAECSQDLKRFKNS